MTITISTGSHSLPAPAGLHAARLVYIVDLGIQETRYGCKSQVALGFELTAAPLDEARNFHLTKTFTASLGARSALRGVIEAWLGYRLPDNAPFVLDDLLGRGCMVNVVHRVVGEMTYSNIASIAPLPQGVAAPEAKFPTISYSHEFPDFEALAQLPMWIQAKVGLAISPDNMPVKVASRSLIPVAVGVSETFDDVPF